ncbi:MAG: hypothetical protein M0Q23_09935 [Syntrophales bacterium]|jgi:hypothetical protein|nr:hypothetical protein [Syntrophales bacterium]MCK9528933.1 hypothetical protein [Syntrophales bacterium]MDX9922185.1 hypothetical protein [Syntrophales bacterium]
MATIEEIAAGVYLVGGPSVSHPEEATAFLLDCETQLVMIDAGAGRSAFRSAIEAWKESMNRLLDMEADILCEGHFGIFTSKRAVRSCIERQLRQN